MSKRLESDVWSLDTCAGCGLCVATCSKQVLKWNGEDHPVLEKRTKTVGYTKETLDSCLFCQKFCEDACPRLQHWSPLEAIGMLTATARGPVKSGAPNDVIRAIVAAGRSAGLLDGVVMLDLDPWTLKPVARVVSSVLEIVSTVGPQYLWAPVFDILNQAVFEEHMESIAVVATPCAAQAVRKLKASTNPRLRPYQDAIRLTLAVFCTGTYRPEMVEEILVKRMDVPREQVKRMEISPDREWMRAVLWDGSVRTIPRQQAESFTRPGCGSCDDYLGESADIAAGTLGALEGTSTLITRSGVGENFVRNAVQMNLPETSHRVDETALAAASAEKGRRERAQSFKDLQILMLDGLSNPFKRNEALQIRREDGFARLVWGLGTRAVERVGNDYPRLVALSHPTLQPDDAPEAIRYYSQRYVDLIDLEKNEFKILPVTDVIAATYPEIRFLVQLEQDGYLVTPRSRVMASDLPRLAITFDHLLQRTAFAERLAEMLRLLEQHFFPPLTWNLQCISPIRPPFRLM